MTDNTKYVEVLLVEDNPFEAELTIRSLDKYHLANNLVHIDDGVEALEFIFCKGKYANRGIENQPKVILLDIKLPRVDGLEILRQLKADERTASIPIVILTSSQEDKDMIQGYKYGVNSYIVKPVEFDVFAKTIADLGMYWMFHNKIPPTQP